jgi:hypothetical protein
MASQVTLFADTNFGGESVVITEAVSDLSKLNFNDKASSAIVEGATWTFYLDANYQGKQADLAPGKYADLGLKNLDEALSSLRPSSEVTSEDPMQQVVFVQPPSYH